MDEESYFSAEEDLFHTAREHCESSPDSPENQASDGVDVSKNANSPQR